LPCTPTTDSDNCVPLLLGHAEHEAVFGDAGVVDQNVDVAEILLYLLHHFLGGCEISRVRSVSLAFHAISGDLLFCLLAVLIDHEVGKCYVAAF